MQLTKRNNKKGFTLIELIAVIVILGILAAVAVPKYLDMTTEAEKAVALGVWAAANGACTMSFSKNLVAVNTGGTAEDEITTGTLLLGAMDPAPTGWSAGTSDIHDTTNTYVISIDTVESAASGQRAILSKNF